MAECYELCALNQFAGLYQASGTLGGWRQGSPSRRWKGQIGRPIGIGSKYRIPARGRRGLFRCRTLLSADPAALAGCRPVHPGIPSDFHIAVACINRTPALFADSDAAPPRIPVERRQRRLPRILLLAFDDIPFENLRRLLARNCHRPSRKCHARGPVHTDNMVLTTTARHCVRADRREAHHSYRRSGSLPAVFRSCNGHRNSDHPLLRLSGGSRRLLGTGASRCGPSAT